MNWSLRQLQVFIAVVEEGGFSAAGDKLRLAQPAVSISIKKLEESLGVKLFQRVSQGVRLTREGGLFLQRARAITGQLLETQREIAQLRSLHKGLITIGAPPMVSGYLLPSILEAFFKKYPDVKVRVSQCGADTIPEKVRSGEIDLGIIADWTIFDDLETVLIENQPIVACASTGSSLARRRQLSWEEFFEQPLILFPRGFYQRTYVEEAAKRHRKGLNITLETENVDLMLAMVKAQRGVATVLRPAAQGKSGVRVIDMPKEALVPVAMCFRKGVMPSLASQALQGVIASRAKRR